MKIRLYGGDYDRMTLDTGVIALDQGDMIRVGDNVIQPYVVLNLPPYGGLVGMYEGTYPLSNGAIPFPRKAVS